MAVAALLYSGFDVLTKWLVVDFSPFQILFFRGAFAFLPWLAWAAREDQPRRVMVTTQPALQILRGVLGFAAVTCFALAFRSLPLAIAVAIAYSSPLYTTALARPLLGESVGATRWWVVALGFVGVLIVAQPGTGLMRAGTAWAIGGAVLYALASLTARRVGTVDRAPTTMFYSMLVYTILGAATLPLVWRQPELAQWAGLADIGIIGGIAQFFLLQAYRLAPASTVSPIEYTILAWSVIWGLLIWNELPDLPSMLGMLVIAAAGLALARHEQRQSRIAIGHGRHH